MDAKDLRIGNLIIRQDLGTGEPRIETVLELRKDKVFTSGPLTVVCDYEDLNPVPLTDEWLFKLGFTKVKNGIELDCGNGIKINSLFTGKPLTLEVYGMRSPLYDISSVHHLQNLYYAINQKELIRKN
ncbi:hypothetical protein [Chryseobacterium indologenes]|uniref:hypothetical protein n=1 Tax=Chryseobacterium indologenes TaxID=253 RepID=UPI00162593F3|nr:hypothetical protein [Chryseobacterium indologenes]